MSKLLLEIITAWREEQNAILKRLLTIMQRVVDGLLTIEALKVSIKYPPAPRAFEVAFDGALEAIDVLANGLAQLPVIVAARVTLSHFRPSKELRGRVMTLEQAAILPAKIIIEQGIRAPVLQTPRAWQLYKLTSLVSRLAAAVRFPTPLSGIKALFGSLWSKIVSLLFVGINLVRCLSLLVLLWNYIDLVSDRSQWPTLFSSALSQANPREKQKVTIRRRLGGVKP